METIQPPSRDYKNLKYNQGYNNHIITEALPGASPYLQNSPQKCKYDLYAEQYSGTSFTAPRAANQKSWLYRIMPSCVHEPLKESNPESYMHYISDFNETKNVKINPNQLRWNPMPIPEKPTNFIEGIFTICGAGSPTLKDGLAIHLYTCNRSMTNEVFQNSDGDLLIVPQLGNLYVITEMGKLLVEPKEILVIPRNIKFSVEVTESSRGYICEIFKGHYKLPEIASGGPNVFQNVRHFEAPAAFYEERSEKFKLIFKFDGTFWETQINHSPFDVAGWNGNYFPYKYNLQNFNAIGTVSYDHPDPSIFAVLTAGTDEPGVAVCDFVIFPDRWMVGEHTFRPPYYHKNVMSEFMGNIYGVYDAKEKFLPGSASLHNIGIGHGPEYDVFQKMSTCELKPVHLTDTMSFMFESNYLLRTTAQALNEKLLDVDYWKCWSSIKPGFCKTEKQ